MLQAGELAPFIPINAYDCGSHKSHLVKDLYSSGSCIEGVLSKFLAGQPITGTPVLQHMWVQVVVASKARDSLVVGT
jgi:hypothetical protein